MNRYFTLFFLLLMVGSSCVYDDHDDCYDSHFIHFSYKGDEQREIFDSKIGNVKLYLFNNQYTNIAIKELNKTQLMGKQGIELTQLAPCDYYMVCVGNAYNNTEIQMKPWQNINEMHIGNPNVFSGKSVETNDSLYIGYKKIHVDKDGLITNDTIKFVSAHIKIYVEVAGYVEFNDHKIEDLTLSIDNLVGSINYKNLSEGQFYNYQPKINYHASSNMYYTQFNVLRFQSKSAIMLNLYNKEGENIFAMKMQDFLKEHTSYDLDKNELLIGIHIEFGTNDISVKVPEWIIDRNLKPIW